MSDEHGPGTVSGATVGAVLRVVEDLRDDMREDNATLERRVMGAFADFSVSHGREHTAERESSQASHQRFDEFLRNAELSQARKDGALGVFRFAAEIVSRNAKPIVAILAAVTAAALALAGNIRFEVLVR